MRTKTFLFFVALIATTNLGASNVITYKATKKLTSSSLDIGTTTFGPAITSHEFANEIGTITCRGEITIIGEHAFSECYYLTSISIPNSVITIEYDAFCKCNSLTSVTIPNSVTTIGNGAFCRCSALKSVTIGNSVTTIGDFAFLSCFDLTTISIPNSVITIGKEAFGECYSLTSIKVDSANTHFVSINDVLFNYAQRTLIQYPAGNPRREYTIPNSVTTIGDNAFYSCDNLTSVSIPNSVKTIGYRTFHNCKGLTSITIPNSVTTIGKWAFENCSSLTSITCYATTPPTCGSECFYKVSKTIPVYVYEQSVDAYKRTKEWKDFTNILPLSQTALSTTTINKMIDKYLIHNHLYILSDGNLYNATGARVK